MMIETVSYPSSPSMANSDNALKKIVDSKRVLWKIIVGFLSILFSEGPNINWNTQLNNLTGYLDRERVLRYLYPVLG